MFKNNPKKAPKIMIDRSRDTGVKQKAMRTLKNKASEIMSNPHKDWGLEEGTPLHEHVPEHLLLITPTGNYFVLDQLQQKEPTTENIYSDEDFVFTPKESRSPNTVKMGNLLFEYTPSGKGSYTLNIEFIDKESKKTIKIFEFDGDRRPGFLFNDIVPFSLGDAATTVPRSADKDFAPIIAYANEVRSALTHMALGESFTLEEFTKRKETFLTALDTFNESAATPVQGEMDYFFGMMGVLDQPDQDNSTPQAGHSAQFFQASNPEKQEEIPEIDRNFAIKLAECVPLMGGIDKMKVEKLVNEYLGNDPTGQKLESMNQDWIDSIMTTPILPINQERGVFCLKTLFTKERFDVTLNEIIQNKKDSQLKEPPVFTKK